jgi:hypothetical protein
MAKKQKKLKSEKLNKKKNKKMAKSKTRKEINQTKMEISSQRDFSEKSNRNIEKGEVVARSEDFSGKVGVKDAAADEVIDTEEKAEKAEKTEDESSYFAKWIAPEHIKTEEDMIIYYASAILSVFAIFWFSFQGSFIVVITFLMLLIVVALHIYQKPRNIELKIDLDGIAFGSVFYKYINIESFEVAEEEYFNVLKFKLKNSILPVKEIQIVDQNPRYIRAVLENFLPEEKQHAALIGFKKKSEFDEYFSEKDLDDYLKEKEKLERLERREKEGK